MHDVRGESGGMLKYNGRLGECRSAKADARVPPFTWIVLLSGGALLFAFPELDYWAAGLFHLKGVGFPAERSAAMQLVRDLVLWPGYLLLGAIALSVGHRWVRGRYLFGLDRKVIAYLIAVAAIGIGLVANALLKENWGRARPRHTVEFGGTSEYTRPLLIADQCESNCSFVAGEGAYGFLFLAFGFLARPERRKPVFIGAAAFGCFVGSMRIMMGAHYLSDVYFAALMMLAVAWILYRLIVVRDLTGSVLRLLPVGR